jgi:hypothetical protein
MSPWNAVELPKDLFFRKDYRIRGGISPAICSTRQGEFGYELTFFGAGVRKESTSRNSV